jgi:hypothetical protein
MNYSQLSVGALQVTRRTTPESMRIKTKPTMPFPRKQSALEELKSINNNE